MTPSLDYTLLKNWYRLPYWQPLLPYEAISSKPLVFGITLPHSLSHSQPVFLPTIFYYRSLTRESTNTQKVLPFSRLVITQSLSSQLIQEPINASTTKRCQIHPSMMNPVSSLAPSKVNAKHDSSNSEEYEYVLAISIFKYMHVANRFTRHI